MIKQRVLFFLLAVIFCFAISNISAQPIADRDYEFQCVYRLTYQTDSLDKNSKDSTDMMLLLNKSNSLFADINTILRDTLLYYRHTNKIEPILTVKEIKSHHVKFRYYIIKTEGGKIETTDWGTGMDFTMYRYNESLDMFGWELSDQTDTISGTPCQKATCYFGKRHWTAWFAPSIPISDGPYKFGGLPGLIIKISDDKNYWSFTLQKLVSHPFSYHFYSIDPSNYKVKNTTKTAFLKSRRSYIDNRYLAQKQSGVRYTDGDETGRKMAEKMAKRDNNWIEIFP